MSVKKQRQALVKRLHEEHALANTALRRAREATTPQQVETLLIEGLKHRRRAALTAHTLKEGRQ